MRVDALLVGVGTSTGCVVCIKVCFNSGSGFGLISLKGGQYT